MKRGRCHAGVIALNVLTAVLVVLDLPIALTAPMNVGMTEAAASHRVLWAEASGALAMLFPIVSAAGMFWSWRFAGSCQHDKSLLCAIIPYFVVTPLITLMVIYW